MANNNNNSLNRPPVVNRKRTHCVFAGVTFLIIVFSVPFVRSRPSVVAKFSAEDDSERKSEKSREMIGTVLGKASKSLFSLPPATEDETTQASPPSTTTGPFSTTLRSGGREVNTALRRGRTGVRFLASNVGSLSSPPTSRGTRDSVPNQAEKTAAQAARQTASSLGKLSSQPAPEEALADDVQKTSQQSQADDVQMTSYQQAQVEDVDGSHSRPGDEEYPYNWIDFSKNEDSCGIRNQSCSPFFASPCSKEWRSDQYEGNCDRSRRHRNWTRCGVLPNDAQAPCWCRGPAATCCYNLTVIPWFPHDVLYLNFTNNSLTRLDEDVLANLTKLQWLILGLNNVAQVSGSAFRGMKSLKRLEFNYNYRRLDPEFPGIDPVNFTKAVNELNGTLQALDINATSFLINPKSKETGFTHVLHNLQLPYLRVLLADDGDPLSNLHMSDIYRLPQLCSLSLGSRQIRKFRPCVIKSFNDSSGLTGDVKTWADDRPGREGAKRSPCVNFSLPHLQVFDLYNNSLVDIPNLCLDTTGNGSVFRSVLPNLKELSLAINAIVSPQRKSFQCLENLVSLALTGNTLKYLQKNLFSEMPYLRSLDIRYTNVMVAEDEVFRHGNLSWLTIKSSNWFFDQHHDPCCISSAVFNGSSLDYADLSYNVFIYTSEKRVQEVLRPLAATARKLLMAGVGVTSVPEIVARDFQRLVVLDLHSNLVSRVPLDTFDRMPHLEYVDLSNNNLAAFRDTDVYEKLIGRNISINLESNPFDCTCELLHFLNLYKTYRDDKHYDISVIPHGAKFVGRNYHCYSPAAWVGRNLTELDLTIHNCLLSLDQEILVVVVCLLLVFCILVYIVLYRYRWQVRFWLYTLHMRLAKGNNSQRRPHARFSAFVSYCREDSNFVLTKLLPALERARHLQLCIHERDFLPGRYITQNVLEYMNQSRHILLVLSNAALKNDQCRFEFFIAQKFALIDRQIRITALVLENLDSQLLDVHVVTLLHVSPNLRWPGDEDSPNPNVEETFWSSLGQTLGSRGARCNHQRARRLLPGNGQRLRRDIDRKT